MKQCTSCTRTAGYKISFNNIVQYFCVQHWSEAKPILDNAKVPYELESIEIPPPKSKLLQDKLHEYDIQMRNVKPLTKEQKELEEQRRIIEGIRKRQNQTPNS